MPTCPRLSGGVPLGRDCARGSRARTTLALGVLLGGALFGVPDRCVAATESVIVWGPGGGPHILTEDFVVGLGEVLQILPGTVVKLDPGVTITMNRGRLEAIGTPEEPILFTWNQPYYHWSAIRFYDSVDNIMSHAVVEHGFKDGEEHWAMIEAEWNSTIEMDHCELRDFVAAGFMARFNCDAVIQDCYVHGAGGRGIVLTQESGSYIGRCEVADIAHDAIEVDGGGSPLAVVIEDNLIHDVGDDGIDTDVYFRGTISGNRIWNVADKGMSLSTDSNLTVFNNICYNCRYGIVVQVRSFATISNCTIYGSHVGLRMVSDPPGASAIMKNVIIWESDLSSIYVDENCTLDATYCCIQNGWWGEGNISGNPRFAGAILGNFHLLPSSPCIDAGTSERPVPDYDIEGDPRTDHPNVPNTGGGDCPYYDIGADEDPATILRLADHRPPREIPPLTVGPNPASGSVIVTFALDGDSALRLHVHDLLGRRVRAVYEGRLAGGDHNLVWDGRDDGGVPVPSGVYFVRFDGDAGTDARRIVLVR